MNLARILWSPHPACGGPTLHHVHFHHSRWYYQNHLPVPLVGEGGGTGEIGLGLLRPQIDPLPPPQCSWILRISIAAAYRQRQALSATYSIDSLITAHLCKLLPHRCCWKYTGFCIVPTAHTTAAWSCIVCTVAAGYTWSCSIPKARDACVYSSGLVVGTIPTANMDTNHQAVKVWHTTEEWQT
jgi:hypothetical protein